MPEVMMMQNKDGSHYIKFLINGDDWRTSKCFDQLEKCKEIFDKLWFAISSNKSIQEKDVFPSLSNFWCNGEMCIVRILYGYAEVFIA